MTTVSDLLHKIEAIDMGSLIQSVVEENEKAIVDLNREVQIFQQGIDSQGRSLSKYEPSTDGQWREEYQSGSIQNPKGGENGRKKLGNTYNLFWSGSSYNTFKTYMRGYSQLFITAAPFARERLIDHGGRDIFGLTPDHVFYVNYKIILPALNEKLKKLL